VVGTVVMKGKTREAVGEGGDVDVEMEMEGSVDRWGARRRGGIWYCEAMVAVVQ
jgi:hypothetical protein